MKKERIKKILLLIVLLIIGFVSVYGVTNNIIYNSNQVGYDNTASGVSSTNVQGAIDELYTRADTLNTDITTCQSNYTTCNTNLTEIQSKWVNPNDMGTPTNYIFDGSNKPTTSSPTTPPSGKNVYLGLYADSQYGVCIKRNGKEHCFRYNNWVAEAKHLQEVFSGANDSCSVSSSYVDCDASDFRCNVLFNGCVACRDRGADERCTVNPDGSVNCN